MFRHFPQGMFYFLSNKAMKIPFEVFLLTIAKIHGFGNDHWHHWLHSVYGIMMYRMLINQRTLVSRVI